MFVVCSGIERLSVGKAGVVCWFLCLRLDNNKAGGRRGEAGHARKIELRHLEAGGVRPKGLYSIQRTQMHNNHSTNQA